MSLDQEVMEILPNHERRIARLEQALVLTKDTLLAQQKINDNLLHGLRTARDMLEKLKGSSNE